MEPFNGGKLDKCRKCGGSRGAEAAVLGTAFESHIIRTKYTKGSTQVSDVTQASETITGNPPAASISSTWQERTGGRVPRQPEQTVMPPEVLADSNELDGRHTQ